MSVTISESQQDGLQELMNISMGQAANSLARLIEAKINLSIPEIKTLGPEGLKAICVSNDFCLTRQSFLGEIHGEVITLFSQQGLSEIGKLMSYQDADDVAQQHALLLDLANILAGACLNGFATQLGLKTSLSMPTIMQANQFARTELKWSDTLVMKIAFYVESLSFDAKVVICFDADSITTALISLDRLMGIE
ncbi:chemotaxis protein CheC [Pseudoalteromonas fenneropenaei]|uniref:Chemotaxis protein CheC n=1 Tax=Pseudoalteromonas fenneropenaei TaxID=1737459 RepID=A0ABV7CFK5_9GAMM